MSAPDQYDRAIAILTKRVSAGDKDPILMAWGNPWTNAAGCLFAFAGRYPLGPGCGCLTQVRARHALAATPELTAAIRADRRLPRDPGKITLEHLPVFAEWQRKLDAELGRRP